MIMHNGMVFGVGLNKTGTTSLSGALDMLGYNAFHHSTNWYPASRVQNALERAIADGETPFRYIRGLRKFNAFFDIRAVERNFEYFDRAYPGSKFILHTRDMDAWLDSREKHVARNRAEGTRKWQSVDREAWTEQWNSQHSRVRDYFSSRRGDMIEFDATRGDGWEKLAPFLDCPIPSYPFPVLNTANAAAKGSGTANTVAGRGLQWTASRARALVHAARSRTSRSD